MDYNYIIYILIFPNGKVYVGQTDDFDRRMNQHKNYSFNKNQNEYNMLIGRAIRKYGWNTVKKEIICTVPEEFVDELETKMIAEYKSADKRFGYNILEIGGSRKGFKHSEETKEKLRIKNLRENNPMFGMCGEKNPMYGKKRIDTSERNKKTNGVNHPFYNKKRPDHSKKLSKSVNMYTIVGEYIKTFESIKQVSEELNINSGNICLVCKGKLKTAGGYIWRYIDG